ncbi:hypothetical protein RSAG8_11475, partial [Rhizoctonia solani AG-8 WAC10335]
MSHEELQHLRGLKGIHEVRTRFPAGQGISIKLSRLLPTPKSRPVRLCRLRRDARARRTNPRRRRRLVILNLATKLRCIELELGSDGELIKSTRKLLESAPGNYTSSTGSPVKSPRMQVEVVLKSPAKAKGKGNTAKKPEKSKMRHDSDDEMVKAPQHKRKAQDIPDEPPSKQQRIAAASFASEPEEQEPEPPKTSARPKPRPRPAPASNPGGKEDQLRPSSTTREVGPKERPSKPEVEAEQAAKETELHPKSTGQPKLPLRDPTNETLSEVGGLGSSDLASGRKRLKHVLRPEPPKPSSGVDELESSIPERPTKRPRFENKSPEPPRAHSPTLEPEPEVEKATQGKKVAGAAPKPSEPLIVVSTSYLMFR